MGNRVKGRVKKKSIKAASHSGMGSKRKLSRMGKRQKKNHSGLDATFIGRSACLKRLQITLKDFRRLCILKGIYPREPRGRTPSNKKGQVYYHIKDLSSLAHEPLLAKFREFRAFMKKVRRAAGRNEKDEAARKESYAPTYTLHHLVRERYPRFMDALSDLDDALALIYLFAAMPSTGRVSSKIIKKAQALAAQWGAYCSTTSSITKSFVSIKGVYMEASIQNCKVRWVIPHAFTQNIPKDVDFRVMATFFEFYETLTGFVLFKLYNDLGVRYPLPVTSSDASDCSSILTANLHVLGKILSSAQGAATTAVMEAIEEQKSSDDQEAKEKDAANVIAAKSKKLNKSVNEALGMIQGDDSDKDSEGEDDDEDGDVDISAPLKDALESLSQEHKIGVGAEKSMTLGEDATKRRNLFAGMTFFLSREVPKGYLEVVCLAYGGKVGWEGNDSPISIKDPHITHHIIDRPKLPSSYDDLPKSREYVQPQWLLDCANFHFILPSSRYAIGEQLPAHLSPWVDDEEEGYKPAYAEEVECLKNGVPYEPDITSDKEEEVPALPADEKSTNESESEDEEANEIAREKQAIDKKKKEEEEAKKMAKSMMSKKASRLYGRMQHGIEKKKEKSENLSRKRKELDAAKTKAANEEPVEKKTAPKKVNIKAPEMNQRKEIENVRGKTPDGKTIQKAKVERLKNERRAIEKKYESNENKGSKKRRKTKK